MTHHANFLKKLGLAASVSMLAIMATGAVASAQEQETNTSPVEALSSEVDDDIIVRGTKFQQSLIDRIPVSVAELPFTLHVLGRDFLDERNFSRPIAALQTLPNMAIAQDLFNTGTPHFLARGFEAPVLIDNRTQNGFRGAGGRDDAFVERYEVLKGPASISLGPVASGGIINTVTKVPEADPFIGVELRVDNFGSVSTELDYNLGSLFGTDAIQARVSGAYRNFNYDAEFTDRETIAIRPVVALILGDATSAKASISYTEHNVVPSKGFPIYSDGTVPEEWDTSTFFGLTNGDGKVKDTYMEAEVNHEFLDNLKLTLRGSNQKTDFDYQNTSGLYNYFYQDGGQGIGLNNPIVNSYSYGGATEDESNFFDAQLATYFDWWGQRQDFVVGGAYNDQTFSRQFTPFPFIGPISVADVNDSPLAGNDTFGPLAPFSDFNNKLYSVFAEAAIRPTDWLTILAGIRYDDVDQVSGRFRGGNRFDSGFTGDKVTFRIGSTAAVSDNINVYASFAQAFTPSFGIRRDNLPVGPELSDGFELGTKGALFDGLLTFEAGVFHTLRKDVTVRDPANQPGEFFFVNVGELRAQGVEFSGNLNPTEGLKINVNYGYTDIDILEAGDAEVTSFAFPKSSGSAFVSYELQSGQMEGLKLGGGMRFVGDRESHLPGTVFKGYTVGDLSLSYPLKEDMDISLNVQNITDELYIESPGGFSGKFTGTVTFGAPRTAVVTLRAKY